MKQIISLGLFIVVFIAFSGCRQKQNDADTLKLAKLDSLLTTQPELVSDSLPCIDFGKLSAYNKAYYQLIDIIAKDKSCFNFTSDSLISHTVDQMSKYRKTQPHRYARALMYQGVVRYRMQITDSTAYLPLKDAAIILSSITPPDLRNSYLCFYYVGKIHERNRNYRLSRDYFVKAADVAGQIPDTTYLCTAFSELFWMHLNISEFAKAKQYLDTIPAYIPTDVKSRISLLNMKSVYSEMTGKYQESIMYEKQILQLVAQEQYKKPLQTDFYNLAIAYKKINKPDSALHYALKTIELSDTVKSDINHHYYITAAQIATELQLWELSSDNYKHAYNILSGNIDKVKSTHILELEKKYNLTNAENKVLHFKSQTYLLAGLILILLLIFIALFLYQIKQKQIKLLIVERNKLLEREKEMLHEKQANLLDDNIKKAQELLNKQLVLSFFQQISMQNLEMKNFLYDLKITPYIVENTVIYEKISKECDSFQRKTTISNSSLFPDSKLTTLTGISAEDIVKLNKSEKLLLLLLTVGVDNTGMAVLFNTTADSIRNRKSQLKKKLNQYQIQLNQPINE